MRSGLLSILAVLLLAGVATAQPAPPGGDDGVQPPLEPAVAEQATEEDQLAIFKMERGFFVSTDLGVFLTFGGIRGYSDAQPYEGITVGYDLNDILSVQLGLNYGYSSNNALASTAFTGGRCPPRFPVPSDQNGDGANDLCTGVEDIGVLMVQPALVLSFLFVERAAVEVKIGGGMSYISPVPDDRGSFGGHVAAGLAFKYLTLMTDFTVGIDTTFTYHFPWGIPALSITPVVRYTF